MDHFALCRVQYPFPAMFFLAMTNGYNVKQQKVIYAIYLPECRLPLLKQVEINRE